MYLLGLDGAYWFFDPHDAKNVRIVSSRFYSYSVAEIRAALFREFSKKFDVSGTEHYLIVYPKSQRNLWAQRFEYLYRKFTHSFRSQKIQIERPQFSLVAIVFHQRQDFLRYTGKSGINLSSRILECYEFKSNRIILYDRTAGRQGRGWGANENVSIHEAIHPMADNTGLHTRHGSTPVWGPKDWRQCSRHVVSGTQLGVVSNPTVSTRSVCKVIVSTRKVKRFNA